jgi:hypothetical protein
MNPTEYFPQALTLNLLALVQSFCNNITKGREPNQIIARNGSPYLFRWMLGRKMEFPSFDNGKLNGMSADWFPSEIENIYLHKFIRSDRDDPHSHPWGNVTLVVSGSYDEDVFINDDQTHVGTFHRTAGDIVVRRPNAIHAITHTSEDCVTLFVTGPKMQDWGFYQDGQFIPDGAYQANSVIDA